MRGGGFSASTCGAEAAPCGGEAAPCGAEAAPCGAEASPRLRAGRRRLTETYKYSTCRLTEWSVCVVVETGGGVMLFTGETLTIENHVSVKTNSFYFLYKFQLFI